MKLRAWKPTVAPTRPTTATEYAELAQDQRGYVVIGILSYRDPPKIREIVKRFAREPLNGVELLVTVETTLQDWKEQAKLFQLRDPNSTATCAAGRFFRCELIKVSGDAL